MPRGALEIAGTKITPFGFSVVPLLIAAGALSLGLFARHERRLADGGGEPLLDPDLLGIPRLRAGASMTVAQQLIIAGTFFVIPLYLQLVLGKDALQTGIAILPVSIAMIVSAVSGAPLARRFSPRLVVQGGLVLLFAGLIGIQATIEPSLNGLAFGIAIGAFGAGMGLVVSQLGNVMMSSVDGSRVSEVGGVQGTAQNLGASLGTALIGSVLLVGLLNGFQDHVRDNPTLSPATEQQILAATDEGIAMTTLAAVGEAARAGGLTTAQAENLQAGYADAELQALKTALLWAAGFALVGLWYAGRLPGEPLESEEGARTERWQPASPSPSRVPRARSARRSSRRSSGRARSADPGHGPAAVRPRDAAGRRSPTAAATCSTAAAVASWSRRRRGRAPGVHDHGRRARRAARVNLDGSRNVFEARGRGGRASGSSTPPRWPPTASTATTPSR